MRVSQNVIKKAEAVTLLFVLSSVLLPQQWLKNVLPKNIATTHISPVMFLSIISWWAAIQQMTAPLRNSEFGLYLTLNISILIWRAITWCHCQVDLRWFGCIYSESTYHSVFAFIFKHSLWDTLIWNFRSICKRFNSYFPHVIDRNLNCHSSFGHQNE